MKINEFLHDCDLNEFNNWLKDIAIIILKMENLLKL